MNLFQSPIIVVSLFSLFWALEIFVSKLAFENGAHIYTFLIQSFLINAFLLGVIVLPKKWREISSLKPSTLGFIFLVNGIHSFGAIISTIGIAFTLASNAAFLMKFTLITTTLIAWIILRESINATKVITIILMLLGMFLLSTNGEIIIPHIGDILIIMACFFWSFGNVMTRFFLKNTDISSEAISVMRPISFFPFLFFIPLFSSFYPEEIQHIFTIDILDTTHLSYSLWAGLFWALLTLAITKTLEIASASYLAMMSMLTPVIVSILAFLILDEQLSPIQYTGAGIIILSGVATHYLKFDK